MKNTIYITVLLLGLALMSFRNRIDKQKKSGTLNLTETLIDTVKKNDSIKITLEEIDTTALQTKLYQENVQASYYANKFNGKRTASGSIFNNNKLTCAHRKLPFGTKLKVTSIKTGKYVFVTVTDRGPFTKGRHIDLSKNAFMQIAPNAYGGHIKVNIEIVKN